MASFALRSASALDCTTAGCFWLFLGSFFDLEDLEVVEDFADFEDFEAPPPLLFEEALAEEPALASLFPEADFVSGAFFELSDFEDFESDLEVVFAVFFEPFCSFLAGSAKETATFRLRDRAVIAMKKNKYIRRIIDSAGPLRAVGHGMQAGQ